MSVNKFRQLAEEAGAVYKVDKNVRKRQVIGRTRKLVSHHC